MPYNLRSSARASTANVKHVEKMPYNLRSSARAVTETTPHIEKIIQKVEKIKYLSKIEKYEIVINILKSANEDFVKAYTWTRKIKNKITEYEKVDINGIGYIYTLKTKKYLGVYDEKDDKFNKSIEDPLINMIKNIEENVVIITKVYSS